jgi:NhaC family Na+:H+ antiporter
VATIGIALNGVGQALGISEGWIAGAIISGAYFGDKMSPLSDTTIMASSVTGTPLFTHIRYMVITTFPSMLITLIVFLIAGFYAEQSTFTNTEIFTKTLGEKFNLSTCFYRFFNHQKISSFGDFILVDACCPCFCFDFSTRNNL